MNETDATETVNLLFDSWYSTLVRVASRALGSLDAAEDVVQEAFLLLYRELRFGNNKVDNPKSWTFTVVQRRAAKEIQRCRKAELAVPTETLETLPGASLDPSEFEAASEDVNRLLSVLTAREEQVVLLRLAPMKYREIAACLNISASSVNTLLARALLKMRQAAHPGVIAGASSSHAEKSIPKTLQ